MRQETKNKDVKTLEEYVEEIAKSSGNRVNAIRKVFQDVASGKAILVDPNTPRDFVEYILRTDYSLWLWTIYTIVILTLVSIATTSLIPITAYIRYVLGSITVLFLPGYVTIEALYPEEKELSNLERLALSIGLSLAIAPLIGLFLNYTPWGIRLLPVLASLTVYIVIIGLVAAYRKYSILSKARTRTIARIPLHSK